jgi:hypothetical protein
MHTNINLNENKSLKPSLTPISFNERHEMLYSMLKVFFSRFIFFHWSVHMQGSERVIYGKMSAMNINLPSMEDIFFMLSRTN